VSNAQEKPEKAKRPRKEPLVDPAASDNLIGFFGLLLEIDRRNNPHLYTAPKADPSQCSIP